ncbi:23S rRNA accumulation protein YceD [Oceaniserpentilla sp. 4NH20-0058]|uniref:YceD family protein n=1 Tax=Oceaniserpentilla sp. 4NH20-0058 TaxID=3127660 RepID=UPI003108ED11
MSTIARIMSHALFPVRVDPLKSVEQEAEFSGSIAVSKLDRLQDFLQDDSGEAQVEIQFGHDEQGTALLRGKSHANVRMTCQRCMNPVEVALVTDFELGIVFSDEQAKHLDKQYEPVIAEHESLELLPVIEDELILSLPMYAYHKECGDHELVDTPKEVEKPVETQAPNNPFSVLEQLKKQ